MIQWDLTPYGKEVGQANYLLARKRQFGTNSVRDEIEKWNVSALALEFHLVKAALEDDRSSALDILPRVILSESIPRNNFYSWPVLEELRSDPRFLQIMARTRRPPDEEGDTQT